MNIRLRLLEAETPWVLRLTYDIEICIDDG